MSVVKNKFVLLMLLMFEGHELEQWMNNKKIFMSGTQIEKQSWILGIKSEEGLQR